MEEAPSAAHRMSRGRSTRVDAQRRGHLASVAGEGAVGDHDGHVISVDARRGADHHLDVGASGQGFPGHRVWPGKPSLSGCRIVTQDIGCHVAFASHVLGLDPVTDHQVAHGLLELLPGHGVEFLDRHPQGSQPPLLGQVSGLLDFELLAAPEEDGGCHRRHQVLVNKQVRRAWHAQSDPGESTGHPAHQLRNAHGHASARA